MTKLTLGAVIVAFKVLFVGLTARMGERSRSKNIWFQGKYVCVCIFHINHIHSNMKYAVANPVRGHKEVRRSTDHVIVTTR